jgi:hypothetical protein
MKLHFDITMKNIFLPFLAAFLLFTFSCAGTPEADSPMDLAQFNAPVKEEIEEKKDYEEIEKVDGLAEIAEVVEIVESEETEETDGLAEIGEIAELEETEKTDGLVDVAEVEEINELIEIVEIEEPREPEVWDTEPLPDEKPLIADTFDDEDFYEPVELAEAELTVHDEPKIEPEFEEETAIVEEPQVTQAPQIVQAAPPSQPEPVREQEPPVQIPAQTVQPAPRQQPVPQTLLVPAEAPAVDRDNSLQWSSIPFRNEPSFSLRDETPVPARQGIVTPQNDEVVFSRIVRATVGQIVEIPFMGTNWVYLGELASRRGIAYDSSRRESEGQSIIFRVEEAGTYVLKFYKRDHIMDYILNDYVQVIVGEAPSSGAGWFNPPIDRGRVVANPRWPSALQEAEILRGGSPGTISDAPSPASPSSGESVTSQGTSPAQGSTPTQGTASAQGSTTTQGTSPVQETVPYQPPAGQPATGAQPVATDPPAAGTVPERQEIPLPEDMMKSAKEAFDAGNVAAAIALLDQFREYYPSGSDEAYWLYGQFYEANSPSRDILLSLDYYRRLVREYPQSSRISDARRRIAYLERFYINIQ